MLANKIRSAVSRRKNVLAQTGLDVDTFLCLAAQIGIPTVTEIRDDLVSLVKGLIPGWIRWLIGGVAGLVVDKLLKEVSTWFKENCV